MTHPPNSPSRLTYSAATMRRTRASIAATAACAHSMSEG